MADDLEPGMRKPSGLRTFLWFAVAVAAVIAVTSGWGAIIGALHSVLPAAAGFLSGPGIGGMIATGLKVGIPLFAAGKAWGSHRLNQAIKAENAAIAMGMGYDDDTRGRAQELAAARANSIAQMQDGSNQPVTNQWRESVQRGRSEAVR